MNDATTPPPCYCITGNSRSGTSFLTEMLQSAGLDVGQRLMGPSESNPHGHFEDLDFHEFHVAVLTSQGYGYEGYVLEPSLKVQEQYVGLARSMVEQRRRAGRPWGWKEPRSTLFLDFWRELVPELRFLLLFRRPWDVIDSLFRRGDTVFARNPGFAVQVLQNYNRAILDFHDRFPDRCMLIESFAAANEPGRLTDAIAARFGDSFGPVGEIYEDKLFRHTTHSQQRSVLAHFHPEVLALYDELRSRASLVQGPEESSSDAAGAGAGAGAAVDWAMQYWVDYRKLEVRSRDVERQLQDRIAETSRQAQAERDRLVAQAVEARADASLLHSESTRLRIELERTRAHSLQARADLSLVHGEADELRADLARAHGEAGELRADLAQSRDEVRELKVDLALVHGEADELRAVLALVHGETDELRAKLARAESELEHAEARLAWVESSRFWKLRRLWVGLKVGLLASRRVAFGPRLLSPRDRIDRGSPGIFSRFGTRVRVAIRARRPSRRGRTASPRN